MEQFKLVCPCLLGMEGLVAEELRRMEAQNVRPENGRVLCDGDFTMLARINLCSRFAERVQIFMGVFRADTFDGLFEQVRALPWENFVGKKDRFPVKGKTLSSKLMSVPDCQSIIKKAVVERLKSKYRTEWFEETGSLYQIQFLILKDMVSLMIDTSGAGLYKRGYRRHAGPAPLKETLAAAMADLSRVRANHTVIDPMCGSGTILIEAAMKAKNIAPGLHRHFTAQQWQNMPQIIWKREEEAARDAIRRDSAFEGFGYDIDQQALQLAKENAGKAGVADAIAFQARDICDFYETMPRASVICNPPYGERLLDLKQARKLYSIMGARFEKKPGWSYTVISPDKLFERFFGRQADKRRKLYNGMIKCQVYMYFKNETD
ncbi:MAG TPA: class I SAM-dependent RNA methyltransferase [Candidatus Scatavimonas merdigallinarum]|uniref:Class I SAM-dependent RNA methyltransferase n=1 Tax=Candidatus Scatavimonas merdigallinarum TaxID=2840914 RepID=A0A9D1CTN2_9FIRM|nr:class I SAM-dependent RNA methyltransferase [Candidatus Scatavimonas merdigallinarum]